MKSVSDKIETLRIAVAQSILRTTLDAIERLKSNDLPKKDALVVARIAGISAAKKTGDLIPFCHPLPLDFVDIEYQIGSDTVTFTATASTVAKTGVEMEALIATSVAALTLYDMLKPLDVEMEMVSTKLVSKRGGKSDFIERLPKGFSAAIIVTSDGTSQGKRQDKSGKVIQERLRSYGIEAHYAILPDEKELIIDELKKLCEKNIQLILTTGGTGLGPRDVTVEATREVIEREIPGIMEAGRAYGQKRTPYAMLSRGLAGQKGNTLIVNLPGSSKGTEETLNAIFPAILHGYGMMRGAGH